MSRDSPKKGVRLADVSQRPQTSYLVWGVPHARGIKVILV